MGSTPSAPRSRPTVKCQAPRRRTWTRGRFTALIAAALITVACTDTAPSVTPSVGPSATPSSPPLPEQPWTLTGSGPIVGSVPRAVASRGQTVVLVGVAALGSSSLESATDPMFYASTDGGTWTPGRVVTGSSTGWVEDVVGYDGGFVAVGWDACGGLPWLSVDYTGCSPAIWTSADGASWQRVDDLDYPNAGLAAVVTWEGGLLATGGGGLVLHSNDGRVWTSVEPSPASADAILGLATDEDTVVAVGTCAQVPASPCDSPLTAWVSSDGATWSEPEPLFVPEDFQPITLDVARTERGYVAISSGSARSAAWLRGADGWEPLAPFGEPGVALLGIAASPEGALIVGYQGAGGGRVVLFGSRDGASWLQLLPSGAADGSSTMPLSVRWRDDRFLVGIVQSNQILVLDGLPHLPTPAEVAAATPLPTLPPQVIYQARASTSAEITGIDGLLPTTGTGVCMSRFAEQSLGQLTANHLAEFQGGSLQANFEVEAPSSVGGSVEIRFNLDGAELAQGSGVRSWSGAGRFSELSPDGTSGTITFTDLPPFVATGTSDSSRSTISGSLSWMCEPWLNPDATATPARAGSVTATVVDPGWATENGEATCSFELGSVLWAVSGDVGSLNGSRIGTQVYLSSGPRAAEPWVRQEIQVWLSVKDDPIVNWVGSATITELSAEGLAGRAEFSNLQRENEAPGWPGALSGDVTWDCE